MAFSRTKFFSGRVYALYERHPLLMNSLIGGLVYVVGELIVELQSTHDHFLKEELTDAQEESAHVAGATLKVKEKGSHISFSLDADADEHVYHLDKINWNRVGNIGLLGVAENGVLMLLWYRLLSRVVGSNVRTATVIIKCILDQIFFASQQDAVFLAYCGYLHSSTFDTAWRDMTKQFLTTWINDCSLWPLVNFIGFAYVPTTLQPTYTSVVQLFWQIYISSMAAPKPITRPTVAAQIAADKAPLVVMETKQASCSICDNKFPHLQQALHYEDPLRIHVLNQHLQTMSAIIPARARLWGSDSEASAGALVVNRGAVATSPAPIANAEQPVFRWFHSNEADRLQALQNAKYSAIALSGVVALRTIICKI